MSEVQALVECPVIVGTAGHVDHGKSALIEALTGKNPDRLEVERRRGMTVELGFGELALPSGKIVGLVDVPGHAHYLRAMVQGATGIDVAVLVVSAVEGVMPQTREHVHVLELLGVTHMVVALTMCDLADAEMTELAELDVDDFLSGTVFAGAPIVPVSSKTGEGIDGLLAVLDEQVGVCWDTCRERAERSDAAPRLPIDRCFTIKGAGTVVTGTLHDAPVAVGDELMALPSRTVCRVRGIQVHGDTPRALPGQRVALNLVGDGVAALDRGEMLGVADLRVLQPSAADAKVGFGVVGELPGAVATVEFMRHIQRTLGVRVVRHSDIASPEVRRVAVCTGAGASMIGEARRAGADIYITADMKYNDFMTPDKALTVADIGHFESEYCAIQILFDILSKNLITFAVRKSEDSRNPVNYLV